MFGRHPRLPIDVEFGLPKSNSGDNSSKSRYVQKLRRRLNYAFQKATKVANHKLISISLVMIRVLEDLNYKKKI